MRKRWDLNAFGIGRSMKLILASIQVAVLVICQTKIGEAEAVWPEFDRAEPTTEWSKHEPRSRGSYCARQGVPAIQEECSEKALSLEIYYGSAPPDRSLFQNTVGVTIVSTDENGKRGSSICSGTLVTPTLVLTARHCIEPTLTKRFEISAVVFGLHMDPTKDPEQITISAKDCADFGSLSYKKCSQTRKSRPTRRDILIVRLDRVAPTFPSRLATENWIDNAKELVAVGYGLTERAADQTRNSGEKLFVNLPVVSNKCMSNERGEKEKSIYGCNPGIELVAGRGSYKRNKEADTCSGDSGGSMYLVRQPSSEIGLGLPTWPYDFYLAATTSRGIYFEQADERCGDGGIYSRIDAKVTSWLKMLGAAEGHNVLLGN